MDFRLIIPRSVSLGHCPKCDRPGSLDRVRNDGIFDKILLKVFQTRSYHCRECKWVGKLFLYKIINKPGKVLINYAIVIISFSLFLLIINYFVQ
jgi:hypothetical protein